MPLQPMDTRELRILEHLADEPDITQPTLAAKLGLAVGTVNWYVKRLVAKGYVKVTRLQRKRLRYLLTPAGLTEKSKLTVAYVEQSMSVYRMTRKRTQDLVRRAQQAGCAAVVVDGSGDLADVVRLTCMEQGVAVVDPAHGVGAPVLRISGLRVELLAEHLPADS